MQIWLIDEMQPTTFQLRSGILLEVTGYGVPDRWGEECRVCRVITRSSVEAVFQAFTERGVPPEAILKILQPSPAKGKQHGNVVLVKLAHNYPVDGIPWRVILMEPGYGQGPRKVALQGRHCTVCRSPDHQKGQCEYFKKLQCGRCGFPLKALKDAGISPHLHDCEGGPEGFGAEFIDPTGSAWHQVQQSARSAQAPAPFEDPAAENRTASLLAARASAKYAIQGAAARSSKRVRSPGSTPEVTTSRMDDKPSPLIV